MGLEQKQDADDLVGPVARAYIRAIQARQPPPTPFVNGSTRRSRLALAKTPPSKAGTPRRAEMENSPVRSLSDSNMFEVSLRQKTPTREPARPSSLSVENSALPTFDSSPPPRRVWRASAPRWSPARGAVNDATSRLAPSASPHFPRAWDADDDADAVHDEEEEEERRSSPVFTRVPPRHVSANLLHEDFTLARYVRLCRHARACLAALAEDEVSPWPASHAK